MADETTVPPEIKLSEEQKAKLGSIRPMAEKALKQIKVLERAGINVAGMRKQLTDGLDIITGMQEHF